MTVEEKIQTLRALDAETDSKTLQTGAIRRGLLCEIEEELRTLRAEKARREVRYFTREQFAERLQISLSSLQRAEGRGEIKPALVVAACDRYSSLQLEFADEIFAGRRTPEGRLRESQRGKGEVKQFQIQDSREKAA